MVLGALACAAALGRPAAADEPKSPLEERVERLEADNAALRALLEQPKPVAHLSLEDVRLRFSGYLDLGFFATQGDGVAYVRDPGKLASPGTGGTPWVFRGDPWSNPINAQGDSADLGLDRTNLPRYDPIASGGHPSFLVNRANLGLKLTVGEHVFSEIGLNFEPRQGRLGSPGDLFEVDLAYLEWIPSRQLDLHVFAGKVESTFGIEYRSRHAPDRPGVTPSLIARYTTGTPTGLKVRGSVGDGRFVYNVAVTNGSTATERFGHFFDEIDHNDAKTLSGRLALVLGGDTVKVELGASGAYGAQDLQSKSGVHQWQVGGDLRVEAGDLVFRGEYLHAHADGGGSEVAPSLHADGFYAEALYQVIPELALLARADLRNARLFADPNLYLTNTLRATGGLRLDLSFHLVAKLEYLHVVELDGPEIPDDVFTSSLVVRF